MPRVAPPLLAWREHCRALPALLPSYDEEAGCPAGLPTLPDGPGCTERAVCVRAAEVVRLQRKFKM